MSDDDSTEYEPVEIEVRSDLLRDFKETIPDEYSDGNEAHALEDAMVLWMATIQLEYQPQQVIEMLEQEE